MSRIVIRELDVAAIGSRGRVDRAAPDGRARYNRVMELKTRTIGGEEFVLVPKRLYARLTRIKRDRKDAEIARKGREDYLSGEMKTISHEELKRKLGL